MNTAVRAAWHSRFAFRLGGVLLLAFIWIVASIVLLGELSRPVLLAEIEQKLSWDVATELSAQLMRAEERHGREAPQIEQALTLFESLYPASGAYLIAADGGVIRELSRSRPLARARIDPGPLRAALTDLSPELPLYGDDPGSAAGSTLFSVAPTRYGEGCEDGHCLLYLTLGRFSSHRASWTDIRGRFSLLPTVFLHLAAIVAGYLIWTSRLRARIGRLTRAVDSFGTGEGGERADPKAANPRGDEIDALYRQIESFGARLAAEQSVVEERGRRRKRMILNLVHDLRIPITSVRGFLELILAPYGSRAPEELRGFLARAQQSTAHLRLLFGDLFLLSELEEGRAAEEKHPASLRTLARTVAESLRPVAEKKGITLICRLEREVPLIELDSTLMSRAIGNLVNNALKFTPPGGTVSVSAESDDSRILLKVSDTGIGIAESEKPYLFDDFYRVQQEQSASIEGAGLGLAIVREIVRKHGGEITVASVEGEGSTFSVELPLAAGQPAPPPPLARRRLTLSTLGGQLPYWLAAACAAASLSSTHVLIRLALCALGAGILSLLSAKRGPSDTQMRQLRRRQSRTSAFESFVCACSASIAVERLIASSTGQLSAFLGLASVFGLLSALPGLPLRTGVLVLPPLTWGIVRGGAALGSPGLFYVGAGIGLIGGLAATAALMPRRFRPLALKSFIGFALLFCLAGLFTVFVGLEDADQQWRQKHREEQQRIAARVAEVQLRPFFNSSAPATSEPLLTEQIRRRIFPAMMLAPFYDFLLLPQDCTVLTNLGPHTKNWVAYDTALAAVGRETGGDCAGRFMRQLRQLTDFSRAPADARNPAGAELLVGLEGSLFNIVSRKAAQLHVPRLLMFGLGIDLIAAAMLAAFVHYAVSRPLTRRQAELRLLETGQRATERAAGTIDTVSPLGPSPLGTEAVQRISEAAQARIAAARVEDDARRSFLREISTAFRPSLDYFERRCARLSAESAGAAPAEDAVRELFEEVLYQAELLRTTFEVTKLEGAELCLAADRIELGALLEDAELGVAQLYENRAVTLRLPSDPLEEPCVFGDAQLLELLFDSLLRQLYFVAARGTEIVLEAVREESMLRLHIQSTRAGLNESGIGQRRTESFALASAVLAAHRLPPLEVRRHDGAIDVDLRFPLREVKGPAEGANEDRDRQDSRSTDCR